VRVEVFVVDKTAQKIVNASWMGYQFVSSFESSLADNLTTTQSPSQKQLTEYRVESLQAAFGAQ
jgi:hypothetical protein